MKVVRERKGQTFADLKVGDVFGFTSMYDQPISSATVFMKIYTATTKGHFVALDGLASVTGVTWLGDYNTWEVKKYETELLIK